MTNPWLSLWLSGANAWGSAARGMMAAEMRKTQDAMAREAVRQTTEFWLPSTKRAATTARKRRAKSR